jgi:uncharacterized protein (DUF302 family)
MANVTNLKRTVDYSYEEALERVPEALKTEGFGVLTEIDVTATLKKKLDVDFRKYTILGACNPPLAHQAISTEIDIGLLLPCNVVVYEDDAGETVVAAVDPETSIGTVDVEGLDEVASDVKARLARVLERLG